VTDPWVERGAKDAKRDLTLEEGLKFKTLWSLENEILSAQLGDKLEAEMELFYY